MFGGGRYDGLVGLFGVEPVPTVGFGMGDVTLQDFLTVHELLPALKPETDVYVILVGDVYEFAQPVIRELRKQGLRLAVDATERKIDKQIRTAEKKGIDYVLFIGARELTDDMYVLKNIQTGEEERHGVARTVSIVKDYRRK
jgi:histidyl-tRNA synthetase